MKDLDEADRKVVAALLAHPRATLGRIGRATGLSEATVSRRMARLLNERLIRIIGVLDLENSHRSRSAFVRLSCRPGTGRRVAHQLAAWPEARSVKLLTGSADCMAEVVFTSNDHLLHLMMDDLPRLDGVVGASTAQVIRRFSTPHAWTAGVLPAATLRALRAERRDHWEERTPPGDDARISELDERLIALLGEDGRLGWQELAERSRVAPNTARRRTEFLMSRGLLRMRTVIEPALLGLPIGAFIWLRISSSRLSSAGQILTNHPAVLMIAATTGEQNLCGEIAVASDQALYEFLTETVGRLPGLLHTDTTVELRALKRAAMLRPEARHADPGNIR